MNLLIRRPRLYSDHWLNTCQVNTVYNWKYIAELKLAVSDPMSSDSIDVIIDADLFGMLILNDVRHDSENEPTTQNTILGWILSRPIAELSEMSQIPSLRITELCLKLSVAIFVVSGRSKRFFRRLLVVLRNNSARNTSEPCIPEYLKDAISSTYRSKTAYQSLGDSRSAAISSFYPMQQHLIRDPINVSENSDFFAEYENFSYMTKNLPTEIMMPDQHYYIPHHAVVTVLYMTVVPLHDYKFSTRHTARQTGCR